MAEHTKIFDNLAGKIKIRSIRPKCTVAAIG